MSASTTAPAESRPSARVRVQQFGTFLSNMVMPNIGAIIAWGLITAFFIPVGWTPNEKIATIVGPGIFYLLPLLIAYTGGYNIYKIRGGVVGATATLGIIMATSSPLFDKSYADTGGSPMFLGAMIVGPFTAWLMKKLDRLWDGKIKPGFEMLVNNFSAGITAAVVAIGAMFILGPILRAVMSWLGNGVEFLINNSLLPITALFVEPAKVLFLNNAINHGVLTPLGLDQARAQGYSPLFLLEANPGPGAGLLLAFILFGRGVSKATAPGALVIQFLGGIHEVYFPYVLSKPKLLLALIAGGASGTLMDVIFKGGLVAPAAPGSIFAVYSSLAKGKFLGVTLTWSVALIVTFVVAALLLKTDRSEDVDLAQATADMEAMKGKKSIASSLSGSGADAAAGAGAAVASGPIHSIVFACDAGMGSSAMGASVLRRKIQEAGFSDVTVVNKAISTLTDDVDLVVTHQDLTARARQQSGSARHVSVENFMGSPRYDEIVELLKETNAPATVGAGSAAAGAGAGAAAGAGLAAAAPVGDDASGSDDSDSVLAADSIKLGGSARTMAEAIDEAGGLLVAAGAVEPDYVASMHERERSVSTFMGNGLAIPHGTNEAKGSIRRTAVSFVRYDEGVDWNGKPATFVVAIAGAGDDHLTVLSRLAKVFGDKAEVARLEQAGSPEEVQEILRSVG